jgi:hypothetical protein
LTTTFENGRQDVPVFACTPGQATRKLWHTTRIAMLQGDNGVVADFEASRAKTIASACRLMLWKLLLLLPG